MKGHVCRNLCELLPSLSGCCLMLFSFLFHVCMPDPGQTISFFHGTFHWSRGGLCLLVPVCVGVCQNPCEVPIVLCKGVLRGEEKETEKR